MTRLAALALLTGCAQILGLSDPSSGPPSDDQPPGDGGVPDGTPVPSVCSGPAPRVPVFGQPTMVLVPSAESFAIAPIDKDTSLDIAVAAKADIFLLLNDGSGGFGQPRPLIPSSSVPADEIALLDLNGDGLSDVASISGSATGWQLNRRIASAGQLEFSSTEDGTLPASAGKATVLFPIDADAAIPGLDLIVGGSNGVAGSFTNSSFPMQFQAQTGQACGTFDADGDDLGDVAMIVEGTLTLFLGDGSDPFGASQRLLANEPECAAAIGDFGGGSTRRTIVAGGSGHIDLFEPSGMTFTQSRFFTDIPLPKDGDTLQVLDVNGDGLADVFSDGALVLTCPSGPAGVAAEPDGQAIHLADPGGRAKLADLDGDGKPDLVEIANGGIQISLQQ